MKITAPTSSSAYLDEILDENRLIDLTVKSESADLENLGATPQSLKV